VKKDGLSISAGKCVTSECKNGQRIIAKYYSLSDGSLNFVKVTLPDRKGHTLPNGVSASGARYTDDLKLIWWIKGETAFAETRTESGECKSRIPTAMRF